ncbi:OmpW family outer membrane protein [Xylella fastidiosa subsp. sandyi]|uniref:OmpW family outer membrane protein n=1 Tax=Xylella fastidiosa TaxID=2371 RepID=UPI00070785F0|nr:OmpW family outer membrane protein [Xylella fastidiosa]KQH74958.1 hypothetical protein AOT81_01495 [Xylella fastidiosa]RWA44201.1 OmpW family protein [Xylella fastidiosa subsp. sandyi]WNY18826.1 OmpW family outer membrane protein [Xylella fastidiosa]WNY21112.1 OmpW family outer membrane protein [Xylella fastidiosa]
MRKISLIGLATMSMLAFNTSAFALGAASSNSDASGKHWSVVGAATLVQPKNGKNAAQNTVKFGGDVAPTLSVTYYINDNVGFELWGITKKLSYTAKTDASGKIGNVTQKTPLALSAQYHFGQAQNVFRPFVGVGYSQAKSRFTALGSTDRVNLGNFRGAIGTIGLDMNVDSNWFARLDARYTRFSNSNSKAALSSSLGLDQNRRLDPWSVGFGIGARF